MQFKITPMATECGFLKKEVTYQVKKETTKFERADSGID